MAAIIITKDGKRYTCYGKDADDIAKEVNGGQKMVKCGSTWIASSTISTVNIVKPDEPERPSTTPDASVNVHHHYYFSDPNR